MSSMNFTCDSCGREVFGCTFVNGMKFCAKCYQETFGETDKDRKITDLEAKLAESEKKAYSRGHSQRDIANEIKLNALREDVANKEKRIVELKQQLAEKEKEIERLNLEFETQEDWQEKWQKLYDETCNLNQDKISFALEQLEYVKDYFIEGYAVCKNFSDFYWNFTEQIDNQIAELTHQHEDKGE